jgi:hypothetical protein
MRDADGAATTPSSGDVHPASNYGQVDDTILMAVIFM